MSFLTDKSWWLDRVYPHAEALPKDAIERHETRLAGEVAAVEALDSEQALRDCLDAYSKLVDEEDARRQGVEQRLTTMIGFCSIAATVVFSVILAEASGTINISNGVLRVAATLSAVYVACQVCFASFAAVRGLERQGWETLRPVDVTQDHGENISLYLRRRANRYLQIHAQHELQNNRKVTYMAVAHEAIKNFIVALVVFAIVGAAFSLLAPGKHESGLVEQLKRNKDLRELLRGPQGPQGPQGPAGPKGDNTATCPPEKVKCPQLNEPEK